jgi:NTE family protein
MKMSRMLRASAVRAAILLSIAALAGCSYPTRNAPMTAAGLAQPYTWKTMEAGAPDDMKDTLVVVTASGGGTRATALAMAVLDAMNRIDLPNGKHLADEVDIISSVSGGSVTAGYFARYGAAGLPDLEKNFVRQDGISALLLKGLNPVGLAELATPSKERIDLLIDYLDKQLFHEETFASLVAKPRRPFLILNAADMVEGVPFPFTQYTLDLLCSDLTKMKLSTAVASSAAFPGAMSAVTMTNYRPCKEDPKPGWMDVVLGADPNDTPADQADKLVQRWADNPTRMAQARVADAYASGAKRYVHLLDGGIADNLGVAEPLRLITGQDVQPMLRQEISHGRIQRVIFIMVNARSFPVSDLDQQQATPGLIPMVLASIDSSIDRATAGTSERARQYLVEQLRLAAEDAAHAGASDLAANYQTAADNTVFVSVDFDAIPGASCRQRFHDIPTSWKLSDPQIDGVKAMGEALLAANPAFPHLLQTLGGAKTEGTFRTIDQACQVYPADTQ